MDSSTISLCSCCLNCAPLKKRVLFASVLTVVRAVRSIEVDPLPCMMRDSMRGSCSLYCLIWVSFWWNSPAKMSRWNELRSTDNRAAWSAALERVLSMCRAAYFVCPPLLLATSALINLYLWGAVSSYHCPAMLVKAHAYLKGSLCTR